MLLALETRIGLLAAVEPRATCPESRLHSQVARRSMSELAMMHHLALKMPESSPRLHSSFSLRRAPRPGSKHIAILWEEADGSNSE